MSRRTLLGNTKQFKENKNNDIKKFYLPIQILIFPLDTPSMQDDLSNSSGQ